MFRPCIDIHQNKVKQIVGGSLSDDTSVVENFVSDKSPADYARLFKQDQLIGGHVIMLGPGNEEAALSALSAYPGGLMIGGGITPENAGMYLENGASHVIVTSYIFTEGQLDMHRLSKVTEAVTKERLVLDLSCRLREKDYYIVTDRWQRYTNFKLIKANIRLLQEYCSEFLIHGVDVEGKKQGLDMKLTELIAENCDIPVTYAGGIRSLEDIHSLNAVGKGRIHYTVGSALDIFGGNLSYKEVIKYDKESSL